MAKLRVRCTGAEVWMKEKAKVIESTKDHVIGTWDNVVILVWKVETTMHALTAIRDAHDQVAIDQGDHVFILTIVEEGAPMPPSATRDAMAELLKSLDQSVELSAVVHEGSGFRAAAVRSVVTGVSLLARLPFPHKVFATVVEAAHWYPANTRRELPWQPKELIDAVADLRARSEAQPPR